MRRAIVVVTCAIVVIWAIGAIQSGQGQSLSEGRPPAAPAVGGAAANLIALSDQGQDGHQQITVIDADSRVMSVYHVDHATGTISLKSVRNIRADLLMDEYNTDSPLPREIRAILSQK